LVLDGLDKWLVLTSLPSRHQTTNYYSCCHMSIQCMEQLWYNVFWRGVWCVNNVILSLVGCVGVSLYYIGGLDGEGSVVLRSQHTCVGAVASLVIQEAIVNRRF